MSFIDLKYISRIFEYPASLQTKAAYEFRKTIFTQLMDFVSAYEFRKCVDQLSYLSAKRQKSFNKNSRTKATTRRRASHAGTSSSADLYCCCWKVGMFFKWIKQNFRVKAFYSTTENAVKTEIWIAISVYVLVAIVKKSLNLDRSLYTILQILSVTIFEKMPIEQVLSNIKDKDHECQVSNQQYLFNEHGDSSDLSKW
jgi:hypothetical protein